VPSDSFSEDVLQRIETEIILKTKSNIEISWEKVDFIPPSLSGKPQLVINNLISQSLSKVV
jgi:hypothetical protein